MSNESKGVSSCYVFKSRLQEYAQKVGLSTPVYETTKEGPSHEPSFKSTVVINDLRFDSLPGFLNRKAAEQSAAEIALLELSKSGEKKECISQPVHETGLCKNLLQEYAQKMNYAIPTYECKKKDGSGRAPQFYCEVNIGGTVYIGAAAVSKKGAEIRAARTALLAIQSCSSEQGEITGTVDYTVVPEKRKRPDTAPEKQETTKSNKKPKKARLKRKPFKKILPIGAGDGQIQGRNVTNFVPNMGGQYLFGPFRNCISNVQGMGCGAMMSADGASNVMNQSFQGVPPGLVPNYPIVNIYYEQAAPSSFQYEPCGGQPAYGSTNAIGVQNSNGGGGGDVGDQSSLDHQTPLVKVEPCGDENGGSSGGAPTLIEGVGLEEVKENPCVKVEPCGDENAGDSGGAPTLIRCVGLEEVTDNPSVRVEPNSDANACGSEGTQTSSNYVGSEEVEKDNPCYDPVSPPVEEQLLAKPSMPVVGATEIDNINNDTMQANGA